MSKTYKPGFAHMNATHLPKLQDRDRQIRKLYLYVAIERASGHVRLALKVDGTTASAASFLGEALGAFPIQGHARADPPCLLPHGRRV